MTYDELQKELSWQPNIASTGEGKSRIIVGGMGGSALPAYAARFLAPALPFFVHHDYDLPEDATDDAQYIAISYSGNTEETLSFAQKAYERGLPLSVITSGGKLAAFGNENNVPLTLVPTGCPPRGALFYLLHALLAVTGHDDLSSLLQNVSFDENDVEMNAQELSTHIGNSFPFFYASRRNGFLSRGGKIMWNETAKAPAGANMFPELNHNEMQAFDTSAGDIASSCCFVLIRDREDDERIMRRMDLFASLMRDRGRNVYELPLPPGSRANALAYTWYLFDQAASLYAESRGLDPDGTPLIEEFKKRL